MSDQLPPPTGQPQPGNTPAAKPFWKRWWVIIIPVLAVFWAIGTLSEQNDGQPKADSEQNSPITANTTTPSTVTATTTPAPLPVAPPSTVAATSTLPPSTGATITSLVTTTSAEPTAERTESLCFDETNDGAGNFDLLEASITRLNDNSGYFFVAIAIGPTAGRDVGLTFGLGERGTSFADPGDLKYVVSGGAYADGTVDKFVADLTTNDELRLDDAFYADGSFSVVVTDDQIARVAGTNFDWDIVLTVDGNDIDDCVVTSFGVTGSPE